MRMRVTYATDESVKYIGHLDLARAWERAIRRARLPLSYSQGFNPQPRIQFAAALPVGFTGSCELVDVYLNEDIDSQAFLARLGQALPQGIHPKAAAAVSNGLPSLQSQVRAAIYYAEVATDEPSAAFSARLDAFLARSSAWRERRRGEKLVRYDLRLLVDSLSYSGPCELGHAFRTRMRSEPGATGRPDELLDELGYGNAARRIRREGLIFGDSGGTRETPKIQLES
jgi:radical SAM-linked protein